MPIDILMPQLSPTMTEGRLANWTVSEGDKVTSGDVIAEVETDKATMEIEAMEDGIVHKIIGEVGADINVGTAIAILKEEGEKVPKNYQPSNQFMQTAEAEITEEISETKTAQTPTSVAQTPTAAPTSAPVVATKAPVSAANTSSSSKTGGTTSGEPTKDSAWKASPLAKRLAQEKGVNLATITGSGPNGRIIKKDVENAQAGVGGVIVRREDSAVRNSPMRKTVAKRLIASKRDVPHFYLNADVNMDAVMQARKQLNSLADGAYKLTVNDFIIKACAMALQKNPQANASWYDDAIVYYGNVDMSVAVAIEDGLITPILQNADKKGIVQISQEMKSLIGQARAGELKPEQYEGGGFTISNLGMYGVKDFQAIVNPPQGAILAVGAAMLQPIVKSDGTIATANVMGISLSVDHRVIDGAVGALLLKDIKAFLENPVAMFV